MPTNICQFCLENKLLQGEILYEDKLLYFVTPDIHDIYYAGGMLVTKRHVATPFELNSEEWEHIHEVLHKLKALVDVHEPDGYNIGWNIGTVAGQNVLHAHMHIFGRFDDEPLAGDGILTIFKQHDNERLYKPTHLTTS